MDQLKALYDFLNWGAPFYYAFASLAFFHFLDSQASERANRAISIG
jgi:hypothetical protein